MMETAQNNQRGLLVALAQARYALSFSNAVSPSLQTHPTREYLTARWMDALAAGTTVAGVPPRCLATQALLWPGALLDLRGVDREEGLGILAKAVHAWGPELAAVNYLRSLERLDWRWRFRALAGNIGESPTKPLEAELEQLREAIHRVRVVDAGTGVGRPVDIATGRPGTGV